MKKDKTKDVIANLTRLPIELLDQIAIEPLQKAQPWERIGALHIIISAHNDEQTQDQRAAEIAKKIRAHAPARKGRQPATHQKTSH